MNETINLQDKLRRFSELWSPRIIAELNGQHVKLAKVRGEFVWHDHAAEDELFLVIHGSLTIRLRDREVHLTAGEMYVVPRGVEHQPYAAQECHLLLIEPVTTAHTGAVVSDRTVSEQEWI